LNTLKAASPGLVKKVLVKENEMVQKGQLIFEVESPVLEERVKYLGGKVKETSQFLSDLQLVTSLPLSDTLSPGIATTLFRQSFTHFLQRLIESQTRFQKVKQDYERNKKLYEEDVIATAEFEDFKFEFEKARGDLGLLKESQLHTWQEERHSYEKDAGDYQSQLAQAMLEKENLNIKAPVTGTIQNLAGVYPGSPVFVNQDLAQISPETNLIAEAYVSPNDVGLLHQGMPVLMQVSAFNYNQWGLLHGEVQEISNDIQMQNDRPVFEIKCRLSQDHLSLKNGYQGKLKKGMSFQACFVVAKRSLWQLLYDKADDWVNPNIAIRKRRP
jgi:HlyD family secretion protein